MVDQALARKEVARPAQDEAKKEPRYTVGSLVHGLNVIKAFDAEHRQMTLTQVAERTDMSRAGARRYLLTLVELGYVYQEERLFRLSPKVMELGYAYLASESLSAIAQTYVERLRDEIGETIGLAVLDDKYVIHVARANSRQGVMAPTLTIGRRFPAIYTSTGRVMIGLREDADIASYASVADPAEGGPARKPSMKSLRDALRDVRRDGYALLEQEMEAGLRTLAVPVFNQAGEVVAALNVLTNIAKVDKDYLLTKCLPMLQAAADEIRRALV